MVWCRFDTITLLKEHDPISWESAKANWESQEVKAETILTFDNGSSYYYANDIENLIQDVE